MTDFSETIRRMKAKDDLALANKALINDGVDNVTVTSGATAAAIVHTENPGQYSKTWESMDRIDQVANALEGGYHGLKKSIKASEAVDAFESADIGLSAFSEDIDGTDEESRKAVEALLEKDTAVNREYKQKELDRANSAAYDYQQLLKDDIKYKAPEDIQAMQERTKDSGFWEGLGEGAKIFFGGDVIGNSIYLAGSSVGAMTPYIVMAAFGNKLGAVSGASALGRALGASFIGYGSYQNEYGNYITEKLQEKGYSLSDPESWRKALSDQAFIDDLKYRASNRAMGVSLFDGLSGYASTLRIRPSALTQSVRKALGKAEKAPTLAGRFGDEVGNLVGQSTLQGVLGGAGEAVGSLAAGDKVDASAVLMEMIGEFTSAPSEVLTLGVSTAHDYREAVKNAETAKQVEQVAQKFTAAAEAISNDLQNEEAVDAWAQRVGEDKTLISFGQDVVNNVDMDALREIDSDLADKVEAAQEKKQSVEISVSRIAKIATKNRDLANALIHESKVDVAGMTPHEAEEFQKTGKAEAEAQFDKILARSKGTRQQLAEAREVAADLSRQLQEAGTTQEVADLQVKPWEMMLANAARMLGTSPKDMAKRMNLRVERSTGGGELLSSFGNVFEIKENQFTNLIKRAKNGDRKPLLEAVNNYLMNIGEEVPKEELKHGQNWARKVVHKTLGEIRVSSRSSRELRGEVINYIDNIVGLPALEYVLTTGQVKWEKNRKQSKKPNVIKYGKLSSDVVIDGTLYNVSAKIEQYADGRLYYFIETKKPPLARNFSQLSTASSEETESSNENYTLNIEVGQSTGGSNNQRGSYTPFNTSTNTYGQAGVITLMQESDKSTFMHESSHVWLDFHTRLGMDIADKFDRGEQLTAGEQEFLRTLGGFFKWGQQEGKISLGVDDTPESVMRAVRAWANLSIDEQRGMHELFAEGFERYLLEGYFPSYEVKDLFQKFKSWLLGIYKSLARQPNPISPEIKKLYDLLFVSEQEVADAEVAAGMIKLFEADDAKVQMTDEERKQYEELNQSASLEAQGIISKAVAGVMRMYTRVRQDTAKAIYRDHKKRIDQRVAELQEEPRYVAFDILTGGLKQSDGTVLKMKLNADLLQAEGYSQETINALAKKGFVYDGRDHNNFISPKELASQVGALDAMALLADLASNDRAKNHSPLARARESLSWSYNMKLNVVELEALGVSADIIATLLDKDLAIDPRVKSATGSSEQLAAACGHPYPADLVSELVDIQDVKQEATEQIAGEIAAETGKTPEIYTQLQSDLAAHNATRSRFLHAEHNAIARMLGKKQLLVTAAREFAKKKIQGMKLNELSAYIFIRDEKKCARLAEQAYIKGDFEACLEYKRGQILNMEMARAALEVQDSYEKTVRRARRIVRSKTIHKPYQKLAVLLMAQHRIGNTNSVDVASIAKESDALLDEIEENGTPIEGLREMLIDTTPVKEMTVEEADNVCSALRELESVGRNFKKQQELAMKRQVAELVAEGKEKLIEAAEAQGKQARIEEVPKGNWEKKLDGIKRFFVDHVKIATWCRIFDQNKDNGFFWNLFVRTANERAAFENTERARVAKALSDILTPVFGNKGAFEQDKVKIGRRMMSKGERFAAACNLGNESNKERLIAGEREQWTDEAIEKLCSSLTAAEWEAVQKVWDLFESFRPMIAEKQKRVYGEEPKWLEPQAFYVTTKDRKSITVRGGYYPVKYDPRASQKQKILDDATAAANELRGAFQSSTTNRSFTKSRVEKPEEGRRLRLDMTALYNGIDDVIHDLAWHEWLIDTRRVLVGVNGVGTGLQATIKERYGSHVADAFDKWREDIAQGDRVPEGSLTKLSGNIGAVAMGWNPMSALVQLTGVGYIVPRCGLKNTLWAIKKFLSSPNESRRNINVASKMMANRALTMNKQVSQIKNRIESGKRNLIKEHAYCMIVAMQSVVDSIAWMAAYAKAMNDETVLQSDNPYDTAVAIADQTVIDTQSSGNISDMSAIERDPRFDVLTVFYSWSNAALNNSYSLAKGERNRSKAYRDLMWMGLVMPVLEKLFRESLKAEDDEEEEDELQAMLKMPLQATIEYHLGMFVFGREIASGVASSVVGEPVYAYRGPSGYQVVDITLNALKQTSNALYNQEVGRGFLNATIDMTSAVLGLPGGQIKKTIKGIQAIESGQAEGIDAIKAPIFGFSGKIDK